MFSLVYVSSAIRPFSEAELRDLLAVSRANNAKLGISGMLLYKAGNFMQVLEGDEATVRALRVKIARDLRHHGVLDLLLEHRSARDFRDWSMGFRDLSSAEARQAPGFSEFMTVDLTDKSFFADPTKAQRLLLTFKKSMT